MLCVSEIRYKIVGLAPQAVAATLRELSTFCKSWVFDGSFLNWNNANEYIDVIRTTLCRVGSQHEITFVTNGAIAGDPVLPADLVVCRIPSLDKGTFLAETGVKLEHAVPKMRALARTHRTTVQLFNYACIVDAVPNHQGLLMSMFGDLPCAIQVWKRLPPLPDDDRIPCECLNALTVVDSEIMLCDRCEGPECSPMIGDCEDSDAIVNAIEVRDTRRNAHKQRLFGGVCSGCRYNYATRTIFVTVKE